MKSTGVITGLTTTMLVLYYGFDAHHPGDFLLWLGAGMVIYSTYSIKHSRLAVQA